MPPEEEDLETEPDPLRDAELFGELTERGAELRDEEGRETEDLEEDGAVLGEMDLELEEVDFGSRDTDPALEGWLVLTEALGALGVEAGLIDRVGLLKAVLGAEERDEFCEED